MKYDVEMSYVTNIMVVVSADSEEEAIEKAKQTVKDEVTIDSGYADAKDLEFESVTYVGKA